MAKPIGELLKEEGIITDEHINYALHVQKAVKKRFGDILRDLGFVTDVEIAITLAKQSGYEYIDLDTVSPSREALSLIPKNFSIQNGVLPIKVENSSLTVAISDPYDERVKAMIGRFFRGEVIYKVAPATILAKKIERFYYIAENPISETIEEMSKTVANGGEISVENLLNLVIEDGIDKTASDIHINPVDEATLISYRIDGVLRLFHALPITIHSRLVSTVKVRSSMDIATTNVPQDGAMIYEFLKEKYDFRVSTVPTIYGENVVIRILGGHSKHISLEQIGFSEKQLEIVRKAIAAPYGIILATGPTGAGKTTTLYALLRRVNSMERNVLTIEDPVEFKIPLIHQVNVNKKANLTFASAIRSFLRQDPDVMLVGEIRDEETATLAIRAALTGHLVLSTLHTNDAVSAISRLKDLGINDFLLSSSLTAVIAQRLVRKLCPHCKKEVEPDSRIKELFSSDSIDRVYEHVGCEACNFTGYLGRIAAAELFLVDEQVKEMIAEGVAISQIRKYLIDEGMTTMREQAMELVKRGLTDIKEVERVFGV